MCDDTLFIIICLFYIARCKTCLLPCTSEPNLSLFQFSQNPHLEKQLIATYPKTMAECSPRDCLWGIGLGANNEKAWNVKTWRGKNLLGYALMEVRKHIMKTKGLIK